VILGGLYALAKGWRTIRGSLDEELVEGVVPLESLPFSSNASHEDDGISSTLRYFIHIKLSGKNPYNFKFNSLKYLFSMH
jgi:hypothetical protein